MQLEQSIMNKQTSFNNPSTLPVTSVTASNLETAINATIRINSHYEIRDIFNPVELDSQGKSIGSGFFIDDDGHILTCNHVIDDSVKIFINIPNSGKKSYEAHIVSLYPEIDLALLKINNYKNKNYIKTGVSDNCKMGYDTIAIGYPLGDDTVKTTRGIISGVKDYLLQTDTPVNSGNSGGPLLNLNYEVIGVNSSKMTGESTEGVGYCVPIDLFRKVSHLMLRPLSKENPDIKIVYAPNLYCEFQTLEDDTAKLLCYEYIKRENTLIEGYMIKFIYKNSPLALCNDPLKNYDIIIEFDGRKVDKYGEIDTGCMMGKVNINYYVLRCKIGQCIYVKYFQIKSQIIVNTFITFKNEYLYKIPEIFYPQKINYINIRGVIICELTLNHLSDMINTKYNTTLTNLANVYSYILKDHRENPKIFISRILPTSESILDKNIENSEGSIIVRVNGKHVSTIEQFKTICNKMFITIDNKKYIHMEMLNHENVTMCIDDI